MSKRKAVVQMASTGSSKGYTDAKANHRNIADQFLKHMAASNPERAARWGEDFTQVPEDEINTEYFFGTFATYISSIAVIPKGNKNAGKHYDNQTAEIILNSLLLQTKERFKSSMLPQTKVAEHAQRARSMQLAARSATASPPLLSCWLTSLRMSSAPCACRISSGTASSRARSRRAGCEA